MTKDFVELARNEDVKLDLGWHVLRNRSTEEMETDGGFEERNRVEAEFLGRGAWATVKEDDKGVEMLRKKLSLMLFEHIKKELPRVKAELGKALEKAKKELDGMGKPRRTVEQQREFLIGIGEGVRVKVEAAVGGNYASAFFAMEEGKLGRRLQAIVQREGEKFAARMRRWGHSREICEDPGSREEEFEQEVKAEEGKPKIEYADFDSDSDSDSNSNASPPRTKPLFLTRPEALQWVLPYVLHSRGRELAGSYNPLLISELFWAQSSSWETLAREHISHIFTLTHALITDALADTVPASQLDIATKIWDHHLDNALNDRLNSAMSELGLLLSDQKRHPITYNTSYTSAVANKPVERDLEHFKRKLGAVLGVPDEGKTVIWASTFWNATPGIEDHGVSNAQKERDIFACEDILDRMLAYYNVALEGFVDNVAMQVVDRRILNQLEGVFSAGVVAGMESNVLGIVAGERVRDVKKRERLERAVKSLEDGKRVFERAIKSRG